MESIREFQLAKERKVKIDLEQVAAVEQIGVTIKIYLKSGQTISVNQEYLLDKNLYCELL